MKEALRKLDPEIKCIIFAKSAEGIQYLIDTPSLPDLVLLDVNMPGLSGKDCLLKIKQHEKLKHLPVVMCSMTDQTKEMKSYFELGAYDFIVKPNSIETFTVALASIISSLSGNKKNKDH